MYDLLWTPQSYSLLALLQHGQMHSYKTRERVSAMLGSGGGPC